MLSAARRGLSAACCVFLSAAGLAVTGPLSTTPAFAAATSEVAVIPPVQPDQLVTDRMVVAGKTGFLHQHTATSAWLWTRYADGITATVPELANIDATNLTGAGGDSVRILTVVPGRTVDGTLTIFDLSTKTWRHPALPTGNIVRFHAYFDDTMLLFTGGGLSGGPELRRFAPDGSWTTIPVTGAPAGTGTFSRFPTAAEPNGMVLLLRGTTDGVAWSRYGLLDFRSGHLSLVPPVTGVLQVLLSDTHLGFRTLSGSVLVFDRAAITAGTAETPVTVPISGAAPASAEVSLLGGDVLTVNPGRDSRAVLHSATGEPRTILPSTQDGSYSWLRTGDAALVVGGTGPRDWAVHRITPGGSEPILPVTEAVTPSGLTLSRGLLRRVVSTSRFAETPRYRFVNHRLAENPGNPISGGTPATANTCTPGATCLRTVDGNAIGTAYLDSGATSSRLTYLAEAGNAVWSTVLPAGGATIVDSSVHHTIVNTTTPPRQYIVRALGTEAPEVRAISGAALWQDTLWTAGAGRLQPRNLSWRTTGAAAPTGSACTATELQATQRHVYWACGGSGPAGVYDLVRKVNVPVPSGQYLLGDGYLARHDGATGDLVRHDLTAGALGAPVALGTFPAGKLPDDRNINWAVDKYSGDVAYVDSAGAVHVIDPGVRRSALSTTLEDSSWGVEFNDYGTRLPYFDLSRPVTSWKVTVTRVATGAVITTRTGGAASTGIGIHWDGYLPNRKRALSGTYRATLTATAGGVTSTAGSAIFGVQCGAPLLHSYECSGVPAVLVVRPGDGRGHWLIARYDRLPFWDQGYTENWSVGWAAGQVNAIVPFGDVNQDFHNDLVVRKADGTLWAHMGIGQSHFGGRQTVKLGSGWNKSDLLFTSGDLTGDGIADLLARDRATGYLYRLNGTGKKSFTAPVRLAGAYKGYTRMLGPGDINSDGRADLLAVDGQGALYGMPGNGNGTFGTIRRIGGGMKAYNAVIGAGDVNQDGRNDLIVRDSAGTLHRLLGTGKGTFGAPQKVGAARNMYLF